MSHAPYDPLKELAARIELHLTVDAVGSEYSLSTEDQQTIINALRFVSAWYAGEGCCPQCQERSAADEKVSYETQLRDCLRDFTSMVETELEWLQTGKGAGVRMRDGVGQWRSLCRDARNILNREDNSYGKKVTRARSSSY